ncbi:hypothetical protein D9M68_484870 [compost metagenome]
MNGLPAPAQTIQMILRPGWSLSLSIRRCAPAVKSVVAGGRYSSCASLAFFSAAPKAFTPSRPNALSCASVATVTPALSMATALEMASWLELRPVRKMYLFHLSPVIESATAGSTIRIFLYSSATGSMASATPEAVGPTASAALSSEYAAASSDLPRSGLPWSSFSMTTSFLPLTIIVPPVA